MIAAIKALRDLPAQFRAGIVEIVSTLTDLKQEVQTMSKGLDALKAADAALATEVQNAAAALKADSDKLAAALSASEGDNDDDVVTAATSLQTKVDALHQLFAPTPAAGG